MSLPNDVGTLLHFKSPPPPPRCPSVCSPSFLVIEGTPSCQHVRHRRHAAQPSKAAARQRTAAPLRPRLRSVQRVHTGSSSKHRVQRNQGAARPQSSPQIRDAGEAVHGQLEAQLGSAPPRRQLTVSSHRVVSCRVQQLCRVVVSWSCRVATVPRSCPAMYPFTALNQYSGSCGTGPRVHIGGQLNFWWNARGSLFIRSKHGRTNTS